MNKKQLSKRLRDLQEELRLGILRNLKEEDVYDTEVVFQLFLLSQEILILKKELETMDSTPYQSIFSPQANKQYWN
ncbi:MAG: hypothetical protein GF313_10190 [Caldithrix sp.]|nr:hypothetical protein [Caldithrix sp.]